MGYNSFLNDMAELTRRRREDQGKRHSLFEGVSELNVGSVFDVPPSDIQFADTGSLNAFGQPTRVLEVVGDDALGEMICVSLQHETILDTQRGATVLAGVRDRVEGPLVGTVEFGAGSGLSTFEFDITTPVIFPGLIRFFGPGFDQSADLQESRRTNGVLLTLPASSMRVYVRNDANAPFMINLPDTPKSFNTFKDPAKVRVHATYGRRTTQAKLTRSYPICLAQTNNGAGPTISFAANQHLVFGLPTYASKVWFPRQPLNTTTLSVSFIQTNLNNINGLAGGPFVRGPFIVAAGSTGGIDIEPYDSFLDISVPAGGTSIDNMLVRFDLAI
jgi:hypothetical protein